MLRILFLCTGNACRSQMAEGWTRHLKSGQVEAHSAGILACGLDPNAVLVMAEAGVDISSQRSKRIEQFLNVSFDYVITLCGHAHESCPAFPRATRVVHVGFDDPPTLALAAKSPQEALFHYRRVRDEIKDFVLGLPDNITESPAQRSAGGTQD